MNKNGFSLVELMVVIAIVALLSAVAVPTFQKYSTKAKISQIVVLMRANGPALNEYIAKYGKIPSSYAVIGSSPYGSFEWEGVYGISFTFNTVLNLPTPNGTTTENKIYYRPHPASNNDVTTWVCSTFNSTVNPLSEWVPAPCARDDVNSEFTVG